MNLESDWAPVLARGPASDCQSETVLAAAVSDYHSERVLVRGVASDCRSGKGSAMELVSALQSGQEFPVRQSSPRFANPAQNVTPSQRIPESSVMQRLQLEFFSLCTSYLAGVIDTLTCPIPVQTESSPCECFQSRSFGRKFSADGAR